MPDLYTPTIRLTPVLAIEAQSDQSLAIKAQNDPAAFGELYRRYLSAVHRYHMARCGNPEDAEDLTAQTFFSALEGIRSFRGEGSFAGWLFSIARRKTALMYRSRKRETSLDDAPEQPDPALEPEEAVQQHMLFQQVVEGLAQLPIDRAEAILLCVFGGLSSQAAGQAMRNSPETVRMLVSRGFKDLRQQFAHTGE